MTYLIQRIDDEKDQWALKVMKRPYSIEQEKEFKILGKLNHPNVLKQIEFYVVEDDYLSPTSQSSKKLCAVTEYCEWGDLFQLVKTEGGFPEAVVKKFLNTLMNVLTYLHNLGIAH